MKRYNLKNWLLSVSMAVCVVQGNVEHALAESVAARENLDKLIKTGSCRDCDLSGLNLNRLDLSGADLQGADLSLVKFHLTNLSGANLKDANLKGATFGGADLGEADLRGADLRGTALDGAYLGGTLLDGEFISTKPYEELGVTEVEKEIYIDDPVKPKRKPEASAVNVGERRDFEEPPPVLRSQPEKVAAKTTAPLPETTPDNIPEAVRPALPAAQEVKKASPVKAVTLEHGTGEQLARSGSENSEIEKSTAIESKKNNQQSAPMPAEKVQGLSAPQYIAEPAKEEDGTSSIALAKDKKKRDNLSRLLDTKRCYGCDLSGLDLSGKDLEKADLEKADLRGCNLEKADLDKANLKGAILSNAILRNASLKETDFYKADLQDADLTGAKFDGTMFDNANLTGVKGYNILSN